MALTASALFFLVNTERQNSFFLLDEDGKRLRGLERRQEPFHVLLNDVAANSPLGLVAANVAQTSLVIRLHEPSGLSLLATRSATNAVRYISS